MNDLDRKIAEEIDDEALFRLAEGEEHRFSPAYCKSMERLYRKAAAHPKRKTVPLRRIVAVAALIAVLTGTAAAATFWEEIQRFFVTNFGQYVELQTDENKEIRKELFAAIPEDWDSFWYFNPEEYRCDMVSAKTVGKRREIVFQNLQGEFALYQWHGNGSINADNETDVISGICVNNKEAYVTEKKINGVTHRSVFWTNEDISFEVRGTLALEELIKAADSIVLIER